jgi:glycosyltransferase involved in cell wall biosynthesis
MVAIKYTGPFTSLSGYGEANRTFVKALHTAGIDVTTEFVYFDNNTQNMFGDTYDLASRLRDRNIDYKVKIIHTPCDSYQKYLEPCKYHIGHLFWETSAMSKEWVWNCNLLDEIWTGSKHNADVFKRSGVTCPIYQFPEVSNTEVDVTPLFGIPTKGLADRFVFLSVFQWIERKNPECLIKAFAKAFSSKDKVTLIIKAYRDKGDAHEQNFFISQIKKWANEIRTSNLPNVWLVTKYLDRHTLDRLLKTADVFVMPHRGEGWGRPMAEAMAVGTTVMATKWGGIHDWLPDNTYWPLDYTMTNVFGMDWAPWYKNDQLWASVDYNHLAEKMRFAFDNPDINKKVGERGKDFATKNFSYEKVGNAMKERLLQIYKKL